MDAYSIAVEPELKPSQVNAIVAGLLSFNAAQNAGDQPHYIVISLRASTGDLVGGLVGAAYLGWLHIQALWMPDELRGRGYGTNLMAMAEAEAVRRGCPRVFLETMSFQALSFYEKLGYVVASKIADFPPGGARYALTKDLANGTLPPVVPGAAGDS